VCCQYWGKIHRYDDLKARFTKLEKVVDLEIILPYWRNYLENYTFIKIIFIGLVIDYTVFGGSFLYKYK
jgi:hypothetical protein